MKLLPLIILTLFILIFNNACLQKHTNKILGTWVVEEFKVDNKDILWEGLVVNMASFKNNGICELPIRDLSLKDGANWRISKVNNIIILSITGSQDTIFNKDFTVSFSKRKQGEATIDVIELKSKNLYWKCSK